MSERRAWVTQPELRMNAYYFGFNETGERAVDEILSAVACAGKGYHHTDQWGDEGDGEPSYAQLIQEAANRAAEKLKTQREADAALVEGAGCWCHAIGGYTSAVPSSIVGGVMHYDVCPHALAAKIRGGA